MSSPNEPDDSWTPRDWQPAEWQPTDDGDTGDGAADPSPWSAEQAGTDGSGGLGADYYHAESSAPGPQDGDDYAPYSDTGGYEDGGFDTGGGYETPPPASAGSATDPYGQPSATPYGQPSADPYGQPSATPYGQPSATPYGQPSGPAQPPPATDSFPAYQAPAPGSGPYGQGPYGGQAPGYGQAGPPAPYGGPPAPYGGYAQSPYAGMGMQVNHPRAVPSMVCGIIGMFCCPILSVVAIVLGVSARKDITNEPQRWTGGGMALAGIILGGISAAYGLLFWLSAMIDTLTS